MSSHYAMPAVVLWKTVDEYKVDIEVYQVSLDGK